MKFPKTIRLGRLLGVPIDLNLSFVVLWGLLLLAQPDPWSAVGLLRSFFVLLVLFASVIVHELGHAMMARREGIETLSITFYPIGGIARINALDLPPWSELKIALAGPIVSFLLSGFLFSVFVLQNLWGWFLPRPLGLLVLYGMVLNLGLGLFNLLPAFPLDGGRILRSALALRLSYPLATRISTVSGRIFALLLMGVGLVANPLLCLIGGVMLIIAMREERNVLLRQAIGRAQVADAMSPPGLILDPALRFSELPPLPESQAYFAVVEPALGRLVGLLRRSTLEATGTGGHRGSILPFVLPLHLSSHPTALLQSVYMAMQTHGQEAVPVLFGRSLVGILSWTDLHRFAKSEIERLRRRW